MNIIISNCQYYVKISLTRRIQQKNFSRFIQTTSLYNIHIYMKTRSKKINVIICQFRRENIFKRKNPTKEFSTAYELQITSLCCIIFPSEVTLIRASSSNGARAFRFGGTCHDDATGGGISIRNPSSPPPTFSTPLHNPLLLDVLPQPLFRSTAPFSISCPPTLASRGKPGLLSSQKPSESSRSLRSSEISARARDRCTRVHSRMMQRGRESSFLFPLTTIVADLRPLSLYNRMHSRTRGCRVFVHPYVDSGDEFFITSACFHHFGMLRRQTLIADSLTNSRNRIIPCKKFKSLFYRLSFVIRKE